MSILAGKKALCFLALPHHNRFLVPIMNALAAKGMEVVYFTAAAEGAFEITLNQAKLPYRHICDYANDDTRAQVNAAIRQLRPTLQERILTSTTLQAVPIVIQDKSIGRAVENYYTIERMIEVEEPDVLFALHELNPWGKILGYLSQEKHIPYFTLQEGLYYSHVFYHRFHTDYSTACMVWGDDCRDILTRAGCSDDKIFPVGNTHIWTAKEQFTGAKQVEQCRRDLDVPADKKVLVFLMSHSQYQPFDARDFIAWMKQRGDVTAIFKWHPLTGKDVIERALSRHRAETLFASVKDYDTYALIGASDVCVTVGNSTTGLEAIAFGKPLIEIRLPDQSYSFAVQEVAELAVGFEDIGAKAEALLNHGLSAERAVKVRQYLARNFAHQDTATLDRMVQLVVEGVASANSSQAAPLAMNKPLAYPCSVIVPVTGAARASLLATLEATASNTPAELFETILIDCGADRPTKELLSALGGDVTVVEGDPAWSYGEACNYAATVAQGKYLAFLKPGLLPAAGWLEGLLQVAETNESIAAVSGIVLDANGLIDHIGVSFDVNQAPFPIYHMLRADFAGARREREFRALYFPYLVSRGRFGDLGGFATELQNRFQDIDFCLRAERCGLQSIYTPRSIWLAFDDSWRPDPECEPFNRIRFFAKWSGSLWQDDDRYLKEDGLTHDELSRLYQTVAQALRVQPGPAQAPSVHSS